jgi:hypothetical protein
MAQNIVDKILRRVDMRAYITDMDMKRADHCIELAIIEA